MDETDGMIDKPSSKLNRSQREETSPCWDMSQERVFIETICNQRFNFFLAFFGASLIGASNADEPNKRLLLILISLCICSLLASKINSTYKRLEAVVNYIREDPTHPETIITKRLSGQSKQNPFTFLVTKHEKIFGMFSVYSVWIPTTCLFVLAMLLLWSVLVETRQPTPGNTHQESTAISNR